MKKTLWKHVEAVRLKSPLVHNITNHVVMNNTANALLAAGASPIMAHAHSEVEDMVNICGALVINIGTLDEYTAESMLRGAKQASLSGKPWVLDPVGAGATPYRNEVLERLLLLKPSVIRGNASEIASLAQTHSGVTKGVDSTLHSIDALQAARILHERIGAVICISGETDIIIGQTGRIKISNGHPLMTRVTGLGCTASSLTGAFVAACGAGTESVAAAMALLGIAGELAEKLSNGPGSLQVHLLDKLFNITEEEFSRTLHITE